MIVLERAGPMGPTARNFKKLEVQPRVARRANSIMPESIDLDEEDDEMGTILDPQTQTQLTQGGDQGMESEVGEGGVKRPAATPPSQPSRKKERAGPSPKKLVFPGFTTLDCGADGSCGFNCIAVGAAIMRGGKFKDLEPKKATMGATPSCPSGSAYCQVATGL